MHDDISVLVIVIVVFLAVHVLSLTDHYQRVLFIILSLSNDNENTPEKMDHQLYFLVINCSSSSSLGQVYVCQVPHFFRICCISGGCATGKHSIKHD